MPENFTNYLILAAIVLMVAYRIYKQKMIKKKLPQLVHRGAVFIDVRTPHEYSRGAKPNSLNIPLNELTKKMSTLNKERPIVVCCASGARSGQAKSLLEQNGFKEVINAGPWQNTL